MAGAEQTPWHWHWQQRIGRQIQWGASLEATAASFDGGESCP